METSAFAAVRKIKNGEVRTGIPMAMCSRGLIAPGEIQTVVERNQLVYRPEFLIVSERTAKSFYIESFIVGHIADGVNSTPIPAWAFRPPFADSTKDDKKEPEEFEELLRRIKSGETIIPLVRLWGNVARIGTDIAVKFCNHDNVPEKFESVVVGTAINDW